METAEVGLALMAEWIEVPAHRVYVLTMVEVLDLFDHVGENGEPVTHGGVPYRFIRRRDGKVFKRARFILQSDRLNDIIALEEI